MRLRIEGAFPAARAGKRSSRTGDVRLLRRIFPRAELRGYQLLSMARRVLRWRRLIAGLDWCDDLLLSRAAEDLNARRAMIEALLAEGYPVPEPTVAPSAVE